MVILDQSNVNATPNPYNMSKNSGANNNPITAQPKKQVSKFKNPNNNSMPSNFSQIIKMNVTKNYHAGYNKPVQQARASELSPLPNAEHARSANKVYSQNQNRAEMRKSSKSLILQPSKDHSTSSNHNGQNSGAFPGSKKHALQLINESSSPEPQIQPPKPKEIIYKNPKIKIGTGKLGPVDLIIYQDDLFALKRVPKKAVDKPKRI